MIKHFLTSLTIFSLMSAFPSYANIDSSERSREDQEFSLFSLTCTDALGRHILPCGQGNRQKKYVGLFYSIWLGQHNKSGIYDINQLLKNNPSALWNPEGTPESPLNQYHFWGCPLYGYYNMKDPWVVTRHIELFINASIDYLCIDATNTFIYPEAARNLLNTLLKFQRMGYNVPKVVFYTNSLSGVTTKALYKYYYADGKYDSLWFRLTDRPMLIGITDKNNKASDMTKFHSYSDFISRDMMDFFDVRESQWPNGDYNENAIPWMSWQYPQRIHKGTVAVPVAQHSHSVVYVSSRHLECSRGYNNITGQVEKDWRYGANFQTMWESVIQRKDSISNVLVTSFNEWMAIKYKDEHNKVFFVDVFSPEFSRDIEMERGENKDNFYMQLVNNVRRYKLGAVKKMNWQTATVDINHFSEAVYDKIPVRYLDLAGEAIPRDYPNAANTARYTDHSDRNDIVEIKVTHNKKNLYFLIKCLDDITPHVDNDTNWMNILIKTDSKSPGFEGYQYMINQYPKEDGTTTIEQSVGGFNWASVGEARYKVQGKYFVIELPLKALGLSRSKCRFEFKVCDNVRKSFDIMNYYVTGDCAPLGRLNYAYGY